METADIRLVVHRRCEVCDGAGEVSSEEWDDYRAWAEDRNRARVEQSPEGYFITFLGMTSVPPMKRECGACEKGWTDDVIPLADVVEYVLERAPKTLLPPEELRSVVSTLRTSLTAAAQKSQGLADPDDAGSWLRVVQEGAEALRSVTELLTRERER